MDWQFLVEPAGFGLSEGWFQVSLDSTYWQVLVAGLLNTLKVALPALVLSISLGVVFGFMRLSGHPAIAGFAAAYVHVFRNIPLLIQLLAIYFVLTQALPIASQAWSLGGWFYLSKSGLAMPAWVHGHWQLPVQGRFAVTGGWILSPEYVAILLALVVYTAAFVTEIVRAGVLAVKPGMQQAAMALGLAPAQVRRHVVLPLALRLVLPPLGNQVLNLLKNASLGVAVGYPELVSVANTSMNQSGKVLECVLLVLLVYALLSAVASAAMNWVNRRVNRGAL